MPPITTAGPEIDQRPMTQRLREGCWDLHQTAEGGDFAARMAKGELDSDAYVAMLQALLGPMRLLDERLVAHRDDVPAIGALLEDEQLQAPNIVADLRHFGVEPAAGSVGDAAGALSELIRQTERRDPGALLGLHYVREGANNGNRFVAIKIRKALGLSESVGVRFLDPYGEAQRARWDAFKKTLDQQPFEGAQRDSIVEAAREMFKGIIGIHKELSAGFPSTNGA